MILKKIQLNIILLFFCLTQCGVFSQALANEIQAAVASNFYNPFREISRQFEKDTGHKVRIIFGSTGKLYAQIIHGAPFELFLSADSKRPMLLEKGNYAVSGSRFTYALGKITLWSVNSDLITSDGKSTLQKKKISHIAMANPKTAPYGKAARQTLKKLRLWEDVRPLLVQGENISQTFQFVASQNAELGFVALSQILDPKNIHKGKRWDVPKSLYDPIEQDTTILKYGENNPGVKDLWKYLKGDKAKQIIKKYGYDLP